MKYFKYLQNIIVPNVTPMSQLVNFETDLLVLTKSDYAIGIEIKVSKSDLKNDLRKKQWVGNTSKPNLKFFEPYKQFYYAVPIELLEDTKKQIPKFVGVLTIQETARKNNFIVRVAQKATTIGNKKWSQKQRLDLARLGTLRIFNLKQKLL